MKNFFSFVFPLQIRHCFGLYDEISRTKERHCNWIRFLRTSSTYSEEVNVIGSRVKGEPIFEVVKNIPANTELVVFFFPERQEEVFFMPAVNYLRNSLYRRTMDTILEGFINQIFLFSFFQKKKKIFLTVKIFPPIFRLAIRSLNISFI